MQLSREPLRSNVELKARVRDRAVALSVATSLGATDEGSFDQTDTYFSLGRYRLKLREQSDGQNWLIGYSRPDSPDARKSQYRLTKVDDPAGTRRILTKQWGVKVVVQKTRHLFLFENRVRIHIDHVKELGDFLEFEAVLDPDAPAGEGAEYDEAAAHLDVARLRHDFGIEDADLVESSYSTLVQHAAV